MTFLKKDTGEKATKSTGTVLDYTKRIQSLKKGFKKQQIEQGQVNEHYTFAQYIVDQKEARQWSYATWRKNKAAGVHYFESIGEEDVAALLRSQNKEGVIEKSTKTSATKKKHLTMEEESLLQLTFKNDHRDVGGWNSPLYVMMNAMLLVGFRPSEVQHCQILQNNEPGCEKLGPPILKVKNAKNTNGRSFGEYRYIGLSRFSKREIMFIHAAINYATQRPIIETAKSQTGTQASQTWQVFYNNMRTAFQTRRDNLFPKAKRKITLYTFRHQCIANLKAHGLKLEEIAAIVGHGNDVTASEHYGKKKFGRTGIVHPEPNPSDVAKVKKVMVNNMKSSASSSPTMK